MVLRVGVVSYLNALPLVDGLEADERLDLVPMPPSAVTAALLADAIDVGLVPVVTLCAAPDLTRVPGIGIASEGPVESVLLLRRTDRAPAGPLRVALDPDSRTSQMLVRILLEEFEGRSAATIEYEELDPGVALAPESGFDAVLAIGDKALRLGGGERWAATDLASAWRDATGLPFVFAVWGLRRRTLDANPWLPERLEQARVRGEGRLAIIARESAGGHGLEVAHASDYLENRLVYRLTEREGAGLEAFLERVRTRLDTPASWGSDACST